MWGWDYATIYFVNALFFSFKFFRKKIFRKMMNLLMMKIHFPKVFSKFSLKIAKEFHPKNVKTLVRT